MLYSLVQRHLEAHPATAVLTETGDSMFNTQKLRLPAEAEYEMQLRCDRRVSFFFGLSTTGCMSVAMPATSRSTRCSFCARGRAMH